MNYETLNQVQGDKIVGMTQSPKREGAFERLVEEDS
jgi:hypothetical protein